VEGRGVPVIRLGDSIRVTCDDSRDHVTVLHAANPKLPSLCVDICTLTCDNAEESKVFLHRKSATTTGYHDRSLRWSDM
jgi:hypothetical protein